MNMDKQLAEVKVEMIRAQIREDIVTLQCCFDQDSFIAAKKVFQQVGIC